MWWLIGYMVIGIAIAEGALWNKRTRPKSVPDEITTGVYSVIVICWLPYLIIYLFNKWWYWNNG